MAATYKRAPEASKSREHENRGRGILCRHAETRGQIFVDRVNFVVVVRLDENVADENAREDRAESKLHVGVIAQRKSFARVFRKKCRRLFPRR